MLRALAAALCLTLAAGAATAQTRITLKSASTGSSYFMMSVQLAEGLKGAGQSQISATVEESQGSVQNIKESAKRPGNFVFTSPPSLVFAARDGQKPFEGESGHDAIRALFVMPAITMHWVVRADTGIQSFADLAGKDFVPGGRGTFAQRQTEQVFRVLGLEGKVKLVDVELAAAVNAVRNRQVSGFATAGSHPAPNLQELAVGTPIRLLGLSPEQMAEVRKLDPSSAPITIPKGTYKGVDHDTVTLSLPVGAYGTTRMDEAAAYAVVKAFWQQKTEMAKANPWWDSVSPDEVMALGVKLHPGALR